MREEVKRISQRFLLTCLEEQSGYLVCQGRLKSLRWGGDRKFGLGFSDSGPVRYLRDNVKKQVSVVLCEFKFQGKSKIRCKFDHLDII